MMITLQVGQDFFGRVARVDAQVVVQFQPAFFVDLVEQCHFVVGRAALYQRAAVVVAHSA